MLTKKDLAPFKNYKFIHIGLVQVAFKPLTLLGVNSSIMAYLRDGRCRDFKPSLAALIETSLCHGPVYFEVFLNLTLSLTYSNLLDAMQLTVHTHGYIFKPGSEIIAICYRMYYKVLQTVNPNINRKRLIPPGTTSVVHTNLLTSNIATNRLIKWNEINFPETWSLPQEIEPEPVINQKIDQIVQTSEGDVEVRFGPHRTITLPRSISSRSISSRYPTPSDYYTAPSECARASTSQIREEIGPVETIRISQNKIPEGIYTNQSRQSPTQSEMSFHIND